MSGPKVVNIQAVRRQQQREGTARLRELRNILEECLVLPEVDFGLRQQAVGVLTELDGLQAQEQWTQLLVRTAGYCQVFRDEADSLRRRGVERRAAELRREQRRRRTDAQLQAELKELPSSAARDEAMRKLAAVGNDGAARTRVAAKVVHWLADSREAATQAKTSERIRELARVYAEPATGGEVPRLPGVASDHEEQRLERCWTLLAELESDTSSEGAAQWKQQLQTVADAEPDQRELLLDSFALEISSSIQTARARKAGTTALQDALSRLEDTHSSEAAAWRSRIDAALTQQSAEEMILLAGSIRAWIAQEQSREDALEQRAAVLRGLTALGYEVREGMAAAWARQGRIVLHKSDDPQYGVEFSAPAVGTSFQARVVASGTHARSQQRDLEVEEAWCMEFARMRSLLMNEGFTMDIVRANAPGTVPVKSVSGENVSVGRRSLPAQAKGKEQAL